MQRENPLVLVSLAGLLLGISATTARADNEWQHRRERRKEWRKHQHELEKDREEWQRELWKHEQELTRKRDEQHREWLKHEREQSKEWHQHRRKHRRHHRDADWYPEYRHPAPYWDDYDDYGALPYPSHYRRQGGVFISRPRFQLWVEW